MGFPYIRTSEHGRAFLTQSTGIGKPGPYIDPGLYSDRSIADAYDWSFPFRVTQDRRTARAMGDQTPQDPIGGLVDRFSEAAGQFEQVTGDVISAVSKIWGDPDTGDVHFGSGPIVSEGVYRDAQGKWSPAITDQGGSLSLVVLVILGLVLLGGK
jgi:hypothetical protein